MRNIRRNAKKIFAVLFTGVILAAAVAIAQEAVYSLNVVGFQKVTAKPTAFTLPGVPFQAASHELNSLVGPQLTAAKNYLAADRIYLWDSASQKYKYYFLNSAIGNKWVSYTNTTVATTNAFIYSNDGFWISTVAASTQTVVLVGDVINVGAVTSSITAGFNLKSYPFSAPRSINEMNLNNGTAAKNYLAADRIFLWDAASQKYVYFFLNSTIGNKWASYTNTTVAASNVINPNDGFWYQAVGPVTWTAMKPYTLD
ncbi:MAG: hypothetical protein AB7T27_03180 [Kiritimatiellia bacterium]